MSGQASSSASAEHESGDVQFKDTYANSLSSSLASSHEEKAPASAKVSNAAIHSEHAGTKSQPRSVSSHSDRLPPESRIQDSTSAQEPAKDTSIQVAWNIGAPVISGATPQQGGTNDGSSFGTGQSDRTLGLVGVSNQTTIVPQNQTATALEVSPKSAASIPDSNNSLGSDTGASGPGVVEAPTNKTELAGDPTAQGSTSLTPEALQGQVSQSQGQLQQLTAKASSVLDPAAPLSDTARQATNVPVKLAKASQVDNKNQSAAPANSTEQPMLPASLEATVATPVTVVPNLPTSTLPDVSAAASFGKPTASNLSGLTAKNKLGIASEKTGDTSSKTQDKSDFDAASVRAPQDSPVIHVHDKMSGTQPQPSPALVATSISPANVLSGQTSIAPGTQTDDAAKQATSNATNPDAQTATPGGVPANTDSQVSSTINSAQVIQSIHQSEMRVGIHSTEFGNLSIKTAVNRDSLAAEISSDHAELTRAIAVHLPSIEEKLGSAYGLQTRVEIRGSNVGNFSDSASHSGQGQQQQDSKPRYASPVSGSSFTGSSTMVAARTAPTLVEGRDRLDIRI